MKASLLLDARALCADCEPGLIGVSGGRDSVALLHTLVQSGVRNLVICHFDHGWRRESVQEGEFVADLARQYGLPCERGTASADSQATAEEQTNVGGKRSAASSFPSPEPLSAVTPSLPTRHSPETAARHARYRFFAEVAARRGCSHLYLAHHADDQVETFFFNLLRGAGGAGLCGMRPVSEQIIESTPLILLRPLLGVWREEIDAYIAAHNLQYCEDPTNAETRHTRNRVRHDILPFIEQALDRHVREPLWRAAEIATAEDEWLAAQTPHFTPGEPLPVQALTTLPLALQRRALHAWLRASGVPNVSFDDVESVLQLTTHESPAKVNLSAHWHARRRAKQLFLERLSP
jgi:tRNA(Ile)-lysidine synthase